MIILLLYVVASESNDNKNTIEFNTTVVTQHLVKKTINASTYHVILTNVVEIENNAFYECDQIRTIKLSETLLFIGDSAFGGCDNLTTITIPDKVNFIGEDVFKGCINLNSINVMKNNEEYTNFNDDCVLYTKNMEKIICFPPNSNKDMFSIPSKVHEIGDDAFYKCTKLVSIEFHNNVSIIGPFAFSNCIKLESVIIPNSLTVIDDETFFGCAALKSVQFSEKSLVEEINAGAFAECNNLVSITLPPNVILIDIHAFYKCENLKSVTILSNLDMIEELAFGCCHKLEHLCYCGSAEPKIKSNAFNHSDTLKLINVGFAYEKDTFGKFAVTKTENAAQMCFEREPTTSTSPEQNKGGLSNGAKAGIIIVVIVFASIFGILVFYIVYMSSLNKRHELMASLNLTL